MQEFLLDVSHVNVFAVHSCTHKSWEGVAERVTPNEGLVSLLEMETDNRNTSSVGRSNTES